MPTAAPPPDRPVRRKVIRLHRAQADFCRSRALYRGFVGGRGSGKSWAISYDLVRRARRGRLYMMVSPTYTILADTDYRAFCSLARDLGVLESRKLSPPEVTLSTGATVLFRSADDPEKLRGPNLSGVTLNEASVMHRDTYDVCIASLREGGEQGWLSAGFTPKGRTHWTYEVFGRGRPDTAVFRAHTKENPFNPAGFAETLARQYGALRQRQELGGEFTDVAGAEFPGGYFDWPGFWFTDWPQPEWFAQDAIKVMALDPSKGADAKVADFQAVVMYARDRNGQEWVEADLAGGDPQTSPCPGRPMVAARAPDGTALTDGMVERTLELHAWFRPEALAVEVNQFQALLLVPFRLVAPLYHTLPNYYPLDNRVNKAVRIRRLGEPLSQRRIRFRDTPGTRMLVDQLREWSEEADYDDGPDALEQARRVALEIWHGRRPRGPAGWRV